jgi:hypothetical protein
MGPATFAWLARVNDAIKRGAITLSSETAAGMIACELLKFLGAG